MMGAERQVRCAGLASTSTRTWNGLAEFSELLQALRAIIGGIALFVILIGLLMLDWGLS